MKVAVLHPDAYMAYSLREGTISSSDISFKNPIFKTCYRMTGPNLHPNSTEGNRTYHAEPCLLQPGTLQFIKRNKVSSI